MKTISLRFSVAVFMFVLASVPVSFASAADNGGYGWYDGGSYATDDWYDGGSYATDDWYSGGSYATDDWYDGGSYANDDWYDGGSYATDDWYDGGSYATDDWYDAGSDDWYDAGYADDWYDAGYSDYGSYDYGCGSYCGGYSYSTPTYSIPSCTWCGGSTYTPPTYTPPTCTKNCGGTYHPPVVSQPAHSSYTNIVTTNTSNNTEITNIDNSINDSFNTYNYNSNNVIAIAGQTSTYTPSAPAPYCVINNAQGNGSNAYIAWSSTNATSAYLSNVGSVAVSGSQTVHGNGTYTLTVYGQNGQSATCSTTVFMTYVPPVNPPYVSLTQIPYTGFDFGPIGNAMYWVSLLGFALAGAYLMVYYRGGAFALATAMVPARKFAPVVAPKAPILVEREAAMLSRDEVKVQPIVAAMKKAAGTLDTMAIVASKDGSMPKIVIQRA